MNKSRTSCVVAKQPSLKLKNQLS